MIPNCKYDKIKVTHKLSSLAWFIEQHGKTDAKAAGDDACLAAMELLHADLNKHLKLFEKLLCE
ncbi:MAG TPA: hypothetical protein VJ201_00755 [Candidatus Babeliales bacterium]|nr:hypothetical protein [Candidatus Babeliales bacterium]